MSERDGDRSPAPSEFLEMAWPTFAQPQTHHNGMSGRDSLMELDNTETHPGTTRGDCSSSEMSESDGSSDDSDNDDEESHRNQQHKPHHWRNRPPLLPQRMATLVSTFSGATRLSIEITALFWEAIFDTISESTSSGMWLSSAAWHEARTIALAVASVFSPLSSFNPRIISRIISSSTAAGYAMANSSFTAAESFLESGFTLYTSAVNMSLYAAGEYMRFIDALFGSTDTSRVLASFVHMCRREAMEKNPEVGALIKEHGLVGFVSQLIKTIAAWICLQVVTHGRERAYRMELVHTNINAESALCPRKFIGCDGKPLPGSEKSSAATPLGTSPRIRVSTITSPELQNELLSVMPSERGNVDGISNISRHMNAQTNRASAGGHGHTNGMYDAEVCAGPADRNADGGGDCSSGSSDTSSDIYYALSDQEISHRDPEWDQQLIDALHNLAIQTNRRNDRRNSTTNINLGEHTDPHSLRRSSKSALWNTLAMVRDANEARVGEPADDNTSSSTNDTSSDSDSQQSPLGSSALHSGRVFPAFESAPASLLSSPQFPTTPSLAAHDAAVHRSRTFAESSSTSHIGVNAYKRPSVIDLPQPPHGISDDTGGIQPLDDIPPVIESDLGDPFARSGSRWMQQEFPCKPLLFNLARFVSVASSVYGHNFMKIVGVKHGTIDAKALIDRFGDFEVQTSRSASAVSIEHQQQHSRNSSMSRLPRAQPMSAYHTHAAYNPSRPNSQRQYERRHFKSSRPETPRNGLRMPGRRPPVRRMHHRRRPVTDHPNHFSFSQHTGIPLSDLLFSSYVPPIVPGVANAASVQASAVERKLRRKQSSSTKKSVSGKRKQSNKDASIASSSVDDAPESLSPPAPNTARKGWISSIPIVGSVYDSLPSPASALSSVPVIPGMVSRIFGVGSSKASTASAASATQSGTEQAKSQTQREPTLNQFRRFDKIRQRLVYRNPSIHALVHYIAVDHSTRSVVLACRGTLGISDLFVDMICEYETIQLSGHQASRMPGQEFRVHSGMWHSALMLANMSSEVFKEVAEALRLYPEYGLVLTGHSLGGGVASLLTLLWSQPLFDHQVQSKPCTPGSAVGSPRRFVTTESFGLVSPRPIHCFSFGSPCSTNAALSYYCRGLVTSVANTDDFATYLSVGAFVDIMNISAVLSRERGVTEKIVRRFVLAQREKIGRKLNLFDFDFSKLRAYSYSDDEDEEVEQDGGGDAGRSWWSWGKSTPAPESSSSSSSRPAKRHKSNAKDKSQLKSDLDDWHWSLVKTLRANMDSEKLYPPGDVFVLASPGDDEVADRQLSELLPKDKENSRDKGKSRSNPAKIPIGLFYCPDVTERFSELRFTRNMLIHHMPSTYERNISALIHETI
ncbi:hypothetical protein GGI15_001975 [Coemansia interrupta]|uniref:sn-1-specific diacylglycerol lipase n=1 Tax=Coemansia interrupta TaxID=1126814 RepID=A0A9W8LLH1_9FUNG|nr:hypothetical protein GGI15_001975 [Coemansia interrupta]